MVNEHGRDEEITAFSNFRDHADQMILGSVNSTISTYIRTSAQGESPLISTLSIDSVSIGFNRTVVHCSDVANPMTSASTTIRIIDISQSELESLHILY